MIWVPKIIPIALCSLIVACSPPQTIERDISEFEYEACTVLKDYMTPRVHIESNPFKIRFIAPEGQFVYVDPSPLHYDDYGRGIVTGDDRIASADTSIEHLQKNITYIRSRTDRVVHDKTFEAFIAAQRMDENYARCELSNHIYDGDDGLSRIEDIVSFNVQQRKIFSQKLKIYNDANSTNGVKLSQEDRQKRHEDYKAFRDKIEAEFEAKPYSLNRVSRIGINQDNGQALFYYEHHCGPLCGGGSYVVMEYVNYNWVVVGHIMTWIS